MSTKSFTGAKKPARQPTPEEIAAFEETGRAIARERKITAKAEKREHRNAESRKHANTEKRESVKPDSQEPAKASISKSVNPGAQIAVNTEGSESANTETQKAPPMVRLTIDLPEEVHTRFKAACAVQRRKMVEEVRHFIERRTAELEGDRGTAR